MGNPDTEYRMGIDSGRLFILLKIELSSFEVSMLVSIPHYFQFGKLLP